MWKARHTRLQNSFQGLVRLRGCWGFGDFLDIFGTFFRLLPVFLGNQGSVGFMGAFAQTVELRGRSVGLIGELSGTKLSGYARLG